MTEPKQKNVKAKAPTGAIRVRTDWDAVERDYRTGKFTLRELENKHGANNATISRKANKQGWTQDLSIAIRQATNSKLIKSIITDECSKTQQNAADTVLAAAEVNTRVILAHRTGLNRITEIKSKLLDQIVQAAENMSELADVIEMARKPDEYGNDKVNDALKKAMGRSALVDDLKKLADVDEKVRKGEREAFGLDDVAAKEDSDKALATMSDSELTVKLVHLLSNK
jgi:hypothetical protein